ncbi:hypothetical protein BCR36DRAFT_373535 [Piromyces finnis]|uniref:Uncharacterized protein n=1 Tax=Piromyces finnis TaxID=1754191 RepID=A0A1Y1UZP8_9FUNG|nr:hypothetical protein BCR36DRAFT_373535 [Piromyces finnis]|eukprot:ORX44054.1 hypothetical protein BCR36DRAFT_373535 [Piromyces finnis]
MSETEAKGKQAMKDNKTASDESVKTSRIPQAMEIEKTERTSTSSMSGVNEYLNKLPDDIINVKTLETELKNTYGGNAQIPNYNPENNGATLLASMDNIYKELNNKNNETRVEMQTMMNNNTVKPTELNSVVNEVRQELRQNQLNTAKSSDLLPLENGLTQQQAVNEDSNQEITKLTKRLSLIEKEIENITQQTVDSNVYTENLTTIIKNEMAEKLQATRADSKQAIQKLQEQLITTYHINGKNEDQFNKNMNTFREKLENHAVLQTQLQERIKTLETELINSENNTNIEAKLTTLRKLYEDLLDKYESLQESTKDECVKQCLREITIIKKKLNEVGHLEIDNIQDEYKHLFHSNSKTKKLFNATINQDTLEVTIQPKNETCRKIINTLINEKYLMDASFNNPTEEISFSNISKFRSKSFIGHSTLDDREEEQDKRLNKKLEEQENIFNKKIEDLKNNSHNSYMASSSHSSNNKDDLTTKFNAGFRSEEAKQNYFDVKFHRTKVYNIPEEENRKKFKKLMQETKPDFSSGSKSEQYYHYKTHPRIYNSKVKPVVPFRPVEFQDLPLEIQQNVSGFRTLFNIPAPRYKNKHSGYEFLSSLKAYLQAYCPRINEMQICDAIIARGGKEVKQWFENTYKTKIDNKDLAWNESTTWQKLNNFIYQFENEFCELSLQEQENKWKSLKINTLNIENLELLIEEIEKIGNNINKSYFSRFTKLSRTLPANFAEKCLEKLPKLPIRDPREDFNEQNEENEEIYKDFIEIIFKTIAEIEGNKSMKEDLKTFVNNYKDTPNKSKIKPQSKYSNIHSDKWNKKHKETKINANKGRPTSNYNIKKSILDSNIKEYQKKRFTQKFIHNTIESIKNLKYLNNPRFGGRMHYNKAVVINNKYMAKYAIVLLDSGSAGNCIGENIVNNLNNTVILPLELKLNKEYTTLLTLNSISCLLTALYNISRRISTSTRLY